MFSKKEKFKLLRLGIPCGYLSTPWDLFVRELLLWETFHTLKRLRSSPSHFPTSGTLPSTFPTWSDSTFYWASFPCSTPRCGTCTISGRLRRFFWEIISYFDLDARILELRNTSPTRRKKIKNAMFVHVLCKCKIPCPKCNCPWSFNKLLSLK